MTCNDVIHLYLPNTVASLVESGFERGVFFCKAKGYPTANFLGWIPANGSNITNLEQASLHLGTYKFETTLFASLPLDAVSCTVGGISCVFDNGNGDYQVQSPIMDCPTGTLDDLTK